MFRHSIRALVLGLCTLTAATPAAAAMALPAPAPQYRTTPAQAPELRSQTLSDLATAMKAEAFAYACLDLFATEADRQAHPAVGKLFRGTAQTELDGYLRQAAALAGTVGTNGANLRQAISGETYEHQVMYRRFAEQARADGDLKAAELFTELARDEGRHRDAYRTALSAVTTGRGAVPVPPKADRVAVPAGLPKVTAARTKANLQTAMHGEALAHAKYMLFAAHARQTGHAALARLFEGTATVELREHFAGEAALAGLVGTTKANLRKAIEQAADLAPGLAGRATSVGDTAVARYFRNLAAGEAGHAAAFRQALNQLG
ncbi:ferritin family protein [Streptomyces misionensis]|uniref:ferritin family protein n=1 Tax=Streptomyces misionensis TaxID=67331 RepID=UPI003676BF90